METQTYTPLPDFISVLDFFSFDVYTEDKANLGIYQISIKGNVPNTFMDPVYMEELLIELTVKDACAEDEVTNETSIEDTLYYIAEDGVVSYLPTWSHIKEGCPFTYEVRRIVEGVERLLSDAEKLVLTHDNTNGWMDLSTSNYVLDAEIWTIRLFMQSTFSSSEKRDGAHVFDIEFRDICWDSVLQEAIFDETYLMYDVW